MERYFSKMPSQISAREGDAQAQRSREEEVGAVNKDDQNEKKDAMEGVDKPSTSFHGSGVMTKSNKISYRRHFLSAAKGTMGNGVRLSTVNSPHHFISNHIGMRRALTAEVLLYRMEIIGGVRIRPKSQSRSNNSTLLRRSFGCDIRIDDTGELVAEAYSGLNGRLVIHRMTDIRDRVEAIRQYEIDKENEQEMTLNCEYESEADKEKGDYSNDDDDERAHKRQRKFCNVQLKSCYASQYEEVLGLNTGRDLTSCTWSPSDQDVVACCSASVNVK